MSEGRADHHAYRISLLMSQGRFAEAESVCRDALRDDPDDARWLHLLATCQYRQDGREATALETVDRAIALEPDGAAHHDLRARVLVSLRRADEAMRSADEAIRLDPGEADGYAARALVHFHREHWARAEADAREALVADPEHELAAFVLSESLRLQGREAENRASVRGRLERDPLSPGAHVSAGWSALQAGDRDTAETHFLEALRLDPGMEMARRGLLESFKSRAPWYRAWLRFSLWAARFSAGHRWLVILGVFALVRFGRAVFRGPLEPVGTLLTVLWLGLALWSHLASSTANALVLLDRRARHALRRPEVLEAVFSGFGTFLGVLLALVGTISAARVVGPLGMGMFGAAIPFAHTFTNEARVGAWLFGSLGALALLAGVLSSLAIVWPESALEPVSGIATGLAILGVVATTWIVNIPALKR